MNTADQKGSMQILDEKKLEKNDTSVLPHDETFESFGATVLQVIPSWAPQWIISPPTWLLSLNVQTVMLSISAYSVIAFDLTGKHRISQCLVTTASSHTGVSVSLFLKW